MKLPRIDLSSQFGGIGLLEYDPIEPTIAVGDGNVFTMRGEKVRKPIEYVASLDKLMALQPEIIIPSHLNPTIGAAEIFQGMQRIRDAVQYVHDETIAGMNAGKNVYPL